MGRYLRAQPGDRIKVGGQILPFHVLNVDVDGQLTIEHKKLEGTSAKVSVIHGYTAASIVVTGVIIDEDLSDRMAKVKTLEKAFKIAADGNAKALRVVHPVLDARGVRALLWKGLKTADSPDTDEVSVTLTMTEYNAEISALESKANSAAGSSTGSGGGTQPDVNPGSNGKDAKPKGAAGAKTANPLANGFGAGSNAAYGVLGIKR